MRNSLALLSSLVLAALPLPGQDNKELDARLKAIKAKLESLESALDVARKTADDTLWWLRLSDLAEVDKVILVGPPNPKATPRYGIENSRHPQRIYQYTFVPRKLDRTRKHPAIVLPHGGVHRDFGTYHIGKEPVDAVDEYRRRSPIWHVAKLSIPLMITSSTNDRDVNVVEVEQLVAHLKAAGKSFEHKIYQDAPGGHSFMRIDTTFAHGVRKDLYAFLQKHLQ